MSANLGYPQYRSNGDPQKKRKKAEVPDIAAPAGGSAVVPPAALDWSESGDWVQTLFNFFAALWAKIVELEQKLAAAIERMVIASPPAGTSLYEKENLTTIEFAELSKCRPQGGLRRTDNEPSSRRA